MKKTSLLKTIAAMATMLLLLMGCVGSGTQNISTGITAGLELLKAATLSDNDVKAEALKAARYLDSNNRVAPQSNRYAQRLNKLVRNHTREDGLELNYQVYLVKEINAFALADGSIRVFSGLMDMMTDDELLFIIGHEIGHVRKGHHKKALQMAYSTSAAKKGVMASGGQAAGIANGMIGDFTEKLINSQFSQSEERDADDYGLEFLKKNNYKTRGAVSSLEKLVGLGGGSHGILSSHPDPKNRAQRLESKL